MQILNLYQRYFIVILVTLWLFLDTSSATLTQSSSDGLGTSITRFTRTKRFANRRRDIDMYEGMQKSAYGPNGDSLALAENAYALEELTRRMKNKF